MKLLTIIGARPQFIKAATISRAINEHNAKIGTTGQGTHIREIICHTGQHFDANMSDVFFEQLDIPRPDHHLGIASLSHGAMTGRMLEGIEALIQQERPDWVLVYGDTNSTLAGALAAAKLHVPVAHVEAGLRSHNPAMPEEINRVLTDRISTLLLCPTATAIENLIREGFPFPSSGKGAQRIEQVGDVMYDAVLHYRNRAREQYNLDIWGLHDQGYALCTLHRQENTDDPERLSAILAALREISRALAVVLPLHPRTRCRLEQQNNLLALDGLTLIDPLPYLEMQRLQMSARVILTDSGGMQKEAYFHGVPCITMREETEWVETVEAGWNQLTGANKERILGAWHAAKVPGSKASELYGEGQAAEQVIEHLTRAGANG
ncbi:MAG: UDP-N-acetylglucosamine 2-epimerase (non-hydrolyzing) [Chloroflexia bacterium]|nr:UDP-N-acetylglucosamine 2-epimerase (non-hydrolyzing) [Chloroflexia bacterium]